MSCCCYAVSHNGVYLISWHLLSLTVICALILDIVPNSLLTVKDVPDHTVTYIPISSNPGKNIIQSSWTFKTIGQFICQWHCSNVMHFTLLWPPPVYGCVQTKHHKKICFAYSRKFCRSAGLSNYREKPCTVCVRVDPCIVTGLYLTLWPCPVTLFLLVKEWINKM